LRGAQIPWVDEERCTDCGICVEECPVGAISSENDTAIIHMDQCIRCGTCHDVCPQEAVRHDSEKIPELVQANVELTQQCMEACAKYLGGAHEKRKCLERMKKHFNKEKIVAEKTLEELEMVVLD
jgi:uncharacterized Fe-S center protein